MTGAVRSDVPISNISVKLINSLELLSLWNFKDHSIPVKTNPFFRCLSLLSSLPVPFCPPLFFPLFSPSIAFRCLFYPSPVCPSSSSLCLPFFPLPSTLTIKEHVSSSEDQNIISNYFQRELFSSDISRVYFKMDHNVPYKIRAQCKLKYLRYHVSFHILSIWIYT